MHYNLLPYQQEIVRKLVKAVKEANVSYFCFIPLYEDPEQITIGTKPPIKIPCSVGDVRVLESEGLVTLHRSIRGGIEVIEGSTNAKAIEAVDSGFRASLRAEHGKILVNGSVTMGDTYNAAQVGAMGPNAHAHDIRFQQFWKDASPAIDLPSLVCELTKLRPALRERATDDEHDLSLGEIAAAEKAAKANDGPGAMKHLRAAGKWALDAATDIGTTVAAAAIQRAMGMP